jgi:hypothetical protein
MSADAAEGDRTAQARNLRCKGHWHDSLNNKIAKASYIRYHAPYPNLLEGSFPSPALKVSGLILKAPGIAGLNQVQRRGRLNQSHQSFGHDLARISKGD